MVTDSRTDPKILPFVSVVLPVRNEAGHIGPCITSLIEQDYPHDRFEIIAVDGRSEDTTRATLRELQTRHPGVALYVLDNPKRRISPALNIGLQAALGDVIVRMDGHSIAAPDYLRACVKTLRRSQAASVGGMVEVVGSTPFGVGVALATTHWLGAGDSKYRVGCEAGYVDTVPFGAYRRDVLERVGLFDESMVINEDYELNVRIRAAGERIYLDPAIGFTYTPRGSPRSLWAQYFNYGWWRFETVRRHPGSIRWRQAVPPAFVAMLTFALLSAPWSRPAAYGLVLLLLIYGTIITSVAGSRARKAASMWHVAAAFVIVHLAYGLGFTTNLLTRGSFPYRSSSPVIPTLKPAAADARGAGHPVAVPIPHDSLAAVADDGS